MYSVLVIHIDLGMGVYTIGIYSVVYTGIYQVYTRRIIYIINNIMIMLADNTDQY